MATSESVTSAIKRALPTCALVRVTDETGSTACVGGKFVVVVVDDAFAGVGLLDRHRRVNAALAEELKSIHSLQLKTWTVAEAKARGEAV